MVVQTTLRYKVEFNRVGPIRMVGTTHVVSLHFCTCSPSERDLGCSSDISRLMHFAALFSPRPQQ